MLQHTCGDGDFFQEKRKREKESAHREIESGGGQGVVMRREDDPAKGVKMHGAHGGRGYKQWTGLGVQPK